MGIEDLKKVTDQLKYQKNKLSEKLLVAENNAQIKGNTLANLKKSEQALASIENTLKSFSNSLGMSEKMEQQLFGQHILGQSNSQQGSTLFGQTTSQSDILSQSANEIKNAKLMLQQSLLTGLNNNEVIDLAAGYLDEDTSNLENILDQMSALEKEKNLFGKLSSKSVNDLKKINEQIKQQKDRLSNKLTAAENSGKITGNTLA